MAGALAMPVLGIGAGIAGAEPGSPAVTWKLDRPHWDDDWNDWDNGPRGRGWDGRGHQNACAWVPPAVSMWVPPAVC
ncbi:hypothetical protein SAMN04489835_4307 [Mycolicibacterium rutilum]|uniref:Uncharacterized protein n=1 Tax=Mycolicibacterium rutilum TaxID=370526 RepID=A0A1H6L6M7_MYCRU|nr:hypothetical protein [Mycolicibacterium rutilum]SEH80137.1 hypothetical protein SAMN04489835_4307 [Mycolicibacterium rutilum]